VIGCSAAIWPSYAGVVWSGPWRGGYRASARLCGSRPESRLVLGSARDEWLDPAVWRPDRLELDAADPNRAITTRPMLPISPAKHAVIC
jgi:hypothetical protein